MNVAQVALCEHEINQYSSDIIKRMFNQRKLVFLLKYYEFASAQRTYDLNEYYDLRERGVFWPDFIGFCSRNWSLLNIIKIRFLFYKPTINTGPATGKDLIERALEIDRVAEICREKNLIVIHTNGSFARITGEGDRFVRFMPFYNALMQEYNRWISFVIGGGSITLIGFLYGLFKILLMH